MRNVLKISLILFSIGALGAYLPNAIMYLGISKPVLYVASFAAPSAGACTVSGENINWINGNATSGGTGQCTFTINTNYFSATPRCWSSQDVSAGNATYCTANAASSTSVLVQCVSGSATSNASGELFCIGSR